ncbi:MAG TPA: AI-2E family transporter [Candidatus Methylacidiphilales bacterium]|nr:AI-2E family transporter [Candidatus Methylacidiphilales bacterium]
MDTPNEPSPSRAPHDAVEYPTLQQRRILWTSLVALAVTALLGVAGLVFLGFIAFLSWSYPILLPLGLAIIVALVLDPFVGFLQRRGLRRGAATLLVCILFVLGFLFFWAFLLPPLWWQTRDFFMTLPLNLSNVAKSLNDSLQGQPAAQTWLDANLPGLIQEVSRNAANFAYAALAPVGHAFGFILGFGFVPIYVYYFLADQDRISAQWKEFVPLRRAWLRDEVISVLAEINQILVNYFRGQIIVAACNGALTIIGLFLINVPYWLVLGLVAGALSIVPFLGIIISILPALLLAFLSAHGDPTWQWLKPVLVLAVFATVQLCESMFITPRVQSHSTGLHPLAIILGILFWSMLLPGLLGPIVAVPLTCAAVVLLRRYVWQESGN